MDNVRKLVRNIMNEMFVSEEAKGFMQIPPSAGIVIENISDNLIDINLFDFSSRQCLGNISIVRISKRAYSVNTAAASDSFGPLMYEAAMMHIHPMGLCSDRGGHTTPKALSVWKKFYDVRGDVKKSRLKLGDGEFQEHFERGDDGYVLNSLYYRPRSTWFVKAVEKGNMLKKEKKIGTDRIGDICSDFFRGKYTER